MIHLKLVGARSPVASVCSRPSFAVGGDIDFRKLTYRLNFGPTGVSKVPHFTRFLAVEQTIPSDANENAEPRWAWPRTTPLDQSTVQCDCRSVPSCCRGIRAATQQSRSAGEANDRPGRRLSRSKYCISQVGRFGTPSSCLPGREKSVPGRNATKGLTSGLHLCWNR
jgi:hypothetical protein